MIRIKLTMIIMMSLGVLALAVGMFALTQKQISPPAPTNNKTTDCVLENISELNLDVNRKWHLIGKEFTSSTPIASKLTFTHTPDCNLDKVKIEFKLGNQYDEVFSLDDLILRKSEKKEGGIIKLTYGHSINYIDLPAGNYDLRVSLTDVEGETLSKTKKINLSYPVYVAWTLDWEGYNFSDDNLNMIQSLTNRQQKVPITHFFNPRYYVSSTISNRRADEFLNWINKRVRTHNDYIGLHQHMFFDMVAAYGVTVKKQPTWANRGTGSDVPLTSYSYQEQKKIIKGGLDTLAKRGLKDIRAYRAGGWFADENTMKILDELGFTIESSGRTYYDLGNNLPGPWSLRATEQPFYMCKDNQNSACTGDNALKVLQMPNNGGESYRFTANQLVDRFVANYKSGVSKKHVVVNFLSHPEAFWIDNPKMKKLFNHIDRFAYAEDNGPVIYANLDTIKTAWDLNN